MSSIPSKQEEELWEAALNDDEDMIKASKADINAKTPLGNTALNIAASGGCLSAVKALLDKGADIDCLDSDGLTPLFKAVQENEVLVADHLISCGATTYGTDESKMSQLHWAAKNGMTNVVEQLLLNRGSTEVHEVNGKEECGKTPLHYACKEGHLPVVRQLLDFGANPNSKDDIQWTPVHEAAFWGRLPVAVKGGRADIAHHLLDRGAATFIEDSEGTKIIHYASLNGMSTLVQQLVEHDKTWALARDHSDQLPIHKASEGGHVDIVRQLLSCEGFHVDSIDNESMYTPLHEAAFWGRKTVVRYLLDNHASINPKNKCNETPIKLAKILGHTYVAELIRSKGGILEEPSPIQ